jgi:hypothetical protein
MQKQLKKGDLKRKKYKQEFKRQSIKSFKSVSSKFSKKVCNKFRKISIKRYKGKKFRKNYLFLKKSLKYFPSGRLLKYSQFSKRKLRTFLRFNVTVYPNNIFCNLKDGRSNNIIKSMSTGSLKLKTTKKRLNFNIKNFLFMFLKQIVKIKKVRYIKHIFIKIVSPARLKPKILEMLQGGLFKKFVRNKNIILELPAKKVFNGCRPKKDLRKKKQVSLYEK